MTTRPGNSLIEAWLRLVRTSPWLAVPFLAALLALCWALAYLVGGAGVAAPHWFYVPIALSASRFGYVGAVPTALVAGVLAGPLLPLYTESGATQHLSDWLVRTAFFVVGGQFIAWLIETNSRSEGDLESNLGVTRRRVTVLESLLERQARERLAKRWAVERLHEVLESGGPRMVFQPVVDLREGRVTGVESLARFDVDPSRGPDFWFDQAWKAGLGITLELSALRAAVAAAEPLLTQRLALGVNLSPEVLTSEEFREILPELPAEHLVCEVTEHAQVADYESLVEAVRELRELGGRLAIDDVGAGFANLRHIVALGPEIIKLDVSLTRGIDGDRTRRALASCLVSFANQSGSAVVAEGIETAAELNVLQSLGVPFGQGYLLGRPDDVQDLDLPQVRRSVEFARLQAIA